MYIYCIVLFGFFINRALSDNLLLTCQMGDWKCLEKSINDATPAIVSGITSLGVQSSDPLLVDVIEGDLPKVKYTLNDVAVRGFKDCIIKNVKSDLLKLTFSYVMDCPTLSFNGRYTISGSLASKQVEGEGDFKITTGNLYLYVSTDCKLTPGDDGKIYYNMENIQQKNEVCAPINYNFENLFNGSEICGEETNNFINEHWEEVTDEILNPMLYTANEQMIKNVNDYMNTVPLDQMVQNL